MDLQLNGKKAFVAGSSRGLGYAVARRLAMEGCAVALNGRDPEKLARSARDLAEETGVQVIPVPGDVTDPALAPQLIRQSAQTLGGLDLLVTNAGGPPAGKFEDFDDDAWEQAVELSFLSHVRLIRAALPYLRESAAPGILTVTSISVKEPLPGLILSNSVRLATIGLTKSLSQELAAEGIRVNSILPGWTATERVQELMAHRAKVNGTAIEAEFQKQSAVIPLGRMGTPDEFANAAVFLLSPAAGYITGVMLQVDGGLYHGAL